MTLFVLFVSVTAVLSTQQGLSQMGTHARNLSLANIDVQRVIEQIRIQNAACTTVPAAIPLAGNSWNAWLEDASGGGGKSLPAALNGTMVVSCRSLDNTAFCSRNQIGSGEWQYFQSPVSSDQSPMRITVSACWNDRGRIIGECKPDTANPPALIPDDSLPYAASDVAYVIDSVASVTTLITCHS